MKYKYIIYSDDLIIESDDEWILATTGKYAKIGSSDSSYQTLVGLAWNTWGKESLDTWKPRRPIIIKKRKVG